LAVTIIASLFIERPWCKLVCPFGAVLGLFNLIRIIPVRRNKESCVSCHLCSSACPMNIAVENKNCVRDVRCISCLECVSGQTCPQAETVSLSLLPLSKNKKTMKLKAKHVALLILIVLVLGIGTAYVSGYWQSDATKRPAIIQEGEFKGMPDPKDIRGSYSFSDVGKAFDIPVESLLQAFGLEGQDPGRIKLKDLETAYTGSDSKISTSSVRYFVELWTGIYTGGKEATLPPEAEAVLLENGKVVPGK
jgi:ferredoxin